MLSISIFLASLGGTVLFLGFRYWELARGERVIPHVRERLDIYVVTFWQMITRRIPTFEYATFIEWYHILVKKVAFFILVAARFVERKMMHVLEGARRKKSIKRGHTNSSFLKEVRNHKYSVEKPSQDTVQ